MVRRWLARSWELSDRVSETSTRCFDAPAANSGSFRGRLTRSVATAVYRLGVEVHLEATSVTRGVLTRRAGGDAARRGYLTAPTPALGHFADDPGGATLAWSAGNSPGGGLASGVLQYAAHRRE